MGLALQVGLRVRRHAAGGSATRWRHAGSCGQQPAIGDLLMPYFRWTSTAVGTARLVSVNSSWCRTQSSPACCCGLIGGRPGLRLRHPHRVRRTGSSALAGRVLGRLAGRLETMLAYAGSVTGLGCGGGRCRRAAGRRRLLAAALASRCCGSQPGLPLASFHAERPGHRLHRGGCGELACRCQAWNGRQHAGRPQLLRQGGSGTAGWLAFSVLWGMSSSIDREKGVARRPASRPSLVADAGFQQRRPARFTATTGEFDPGGRSCAIPACW